MVDHCQRILDMVQMNTQIILSMNGLLRRLEVHLATPRVHHPSLVFEDAFGVKLLLPFELCQPWDVSLAFQPIYHPRSH